MSQYTAQAIPGPISRAGHSASSMVPAPLSNPLPHAPMRSRARPPSSSHSPQTPGAVPSTSRLADTRTVFRSPQTSHFNSRPGPNHPIAHKWRSWFMNTTTKASTTTQPRRVGLRSANRGSNTSLTTPQKTARVPRPAASMCAASASFSSTTLPFISPVSHRKPAAPVATAWLPPPKSGPSQNPKTCDSRLHTFPRLIASLPPSPYPHRH